MCWESFNRGARVPTSFAGSLRHCSSLTSTSCKTPAPENRIRHPTRIVGTMHPRGGFMPKKEVQPQSKINAQPRIHQHAAEIQAYGTVSHALPLDLDESVRLEMTE